MKKFLLVLLVWGLCFGAAAAENDVAPLIENGVEKNFYDGGALLSEVNIVAGKREGWRKIYFENGRVQQETFFANDKPQGIEKYFYPDGTLRLVARWKDGQLNGAVENYDENGVLELESTFENDLRQGPTILYYPDGKVKRESHFVQDELDGWFKDYDENGVCRAKVLMKNGKNDSVIYYYDENGNLLWVKTYQTYVAFGIGVLAALIVIGGIYLSYRRKNRL